MNDHSYYSEVLCDATMYRMLRDVYSRDPSMSPRTIATMRDIFTSRRNGSNERRQDRL